MKFSQEQMEELVNDLQGTCKSMDDVIANISNGEIDFVGNLENWREVCNFVDDKIFLCRECGWWYDVGFWNTEGYVDGDGEICLDCMPEED